MNHQPRNVLVTGGAGFIGANLVRMLLEETDVPRVVVLDALTYAGNLASLQGLEEAHESRYRFVHGNITDPVLVRHLLAEEAIDTVLHLAAESHVDRSIENPLVFVETNVMGTANLLSEALETWKDRKDVRFHHVSTDEVFGSLGDEGAFTETTPYDPSSPYSASKAGSDHLARAWHATFGLPVTISNCSNNYGPYQHPEKLIPHMISAALAGRPLPVYGKGTNVRDWLFVADHCRAILRIVTTGLPGQTYCVGGGAELPNIQVVHEICACLDRLRPADGPYARQIAFVADRPGHDHRYAIDAAKLSGQLGWTPQETFATGLERTVAWYLDNPAWVEAVNGRHQAGARRGLLPGTAAGATR